MKVKINKINVSSQTLGYDILQMARTLPQSVGALISPTFEYLNNSLRSVEDDFEAHGLIRNVHYTIGKTPPVHFKQPHKKVGNWRDVICFDWGSTVRLHSMTFPNSIRGYSYAYLIIAGSVLIDENDCERLSFPTLRGWQEYSYDSELLYQVFIH